MQAREVLRALAVRDLGRRSGTAAAIELIEKQPAASRRPTVGREAPCGKCASYVAEKRAHQKVMMSAELPAFVSGPRTRLGVTSGSAGLPGIMTDRASAIGDGTRQR